MNADWDLLIAEARERERAWLQMFRDRHLLEQESARPATPDRGDGLRAHLEAAEDRCALLERERDEARHRADRWADLVAAAVRHHHAHHPGCTTLGEPA